MALQILRALAPSTRVIAVDVSEDRLHAVNALPRGGRLGHDAPMRIAVIGSGCSGLCLGIQLKRAGIDAFTIFEKSDRLGGTWRDNTYPGAACDVPSFLYCFSFEQKTDWSRKWSPQAEIRDYMEHCARKYDLVRHIRFGTEIADARFDAGAGVWRLRTTGGEEIVAHGLVSAVGPLKPPPLPGLPGLHRLPRA